MTVVAEKEEREGVRFRIRGGEGQEDERMTMRPGQEGKEDKEGKGGRDGRKRG